MNERQHENKIEKPHTIVKESMMDVPVLVTKFNKTTIFYKTIDNSRIVSYSKPWNKNPWNHLLERIFKDMMINQPGSMFDILLVKYILKNMVGNHVVFTQSMNANRNKLTVDDATKRLSTISRTSDAPKKLKTVPIRYVDFDQSTYVRPSYKRESSKNLVSPKRTIDCSVSVFICFPFDADCS
jgi:hypothetical protein